MEVGEVSLLETMKTQTSVSVEMQKKAIEQARIIIQVLESLPRNHPEDYLGSNYDMTA